MNLPLTAEDNEVRLREIVRPWFESHPSGVVALLDGDRTLTAEDTSRIFLRRAGGDPLGIKRSFETLGYSYEAFRYHTQQHLRLGAQAFDRLAPEIARETQLFPGVVDALRALSTQVSVRVVTAGIPRIWQELLSIHDINGVEVLGGIEPKRPFVLGRREKGLLSQSLRAAGKFVLCVGDSDVDSELLCHSDRAVVVVNHRQNEDLMPNLAGHPSLWQIVPQGTPHPGVPQLTFAGLINLLPVAQTLKERTACL